MIDKGVAAKLNVDDNGERIWDRSFLGGRFALNISGDTITIYQEQDALPFLKKNNAMIIEKPLVLEHGQYIWLNNFFIQATIAGGKSIRLILNPQEQAIKFELEKLKAKALEGLKKSK